MLHLPGKQILSLTADEAFTEAAKVMSGVKSNICVNSKSEMAFLAPEPPCWHSANQDPLLALGGSPWKRPVTYTRSCLHERVAAAPEQDDDEEVSVVNR